MTTSQHMQEARNGAPSATTTTIPAQAAANARPRKHVRSISIEPRFHTIGSYVPEPRARDRAGFLSPQEKQEMELEREAILQIQNAQAAKRRPKIMRLTPAYAAAPRSKSSSPPSSVASSTRTTSEEELITPPDAKVPFPNLSTSAPSTSQAPLHPGSRKALALKANSPGPEVSGLHLDLGCIPSPSAHDQHSVASTSTLPELIRKKSGEPVKSSLKHYPSSALFSSRSSSDASLMSANSRAKSVPSTPNVPKAVHFDAQLEHVKIFRVKGKPQAVSREGSPEQTETETEEEREFPFLGNRRFHANRATGTKTPSPTATPPNEREEQLLLRLPNFPSSAKLSVDRDIFLERIYLSDDLRSVKGTVQVRNLSFEKWVAVRFTLDHWATVNEVSAEYSESVKDGTADRFVFSIKLNELLNWPRGSGAQETKTMFLCLRYTVHDKEIWDNNDGGNYQLDFRKRLLPVSPAPPAAQGEAPSSGVAAGPSSRRYTVAGPAPHTSRIIEMGRRSGVHGQRTKGDFVMEQLRRELDRLRSDEEEQDAILSSGNFVQEMAKRKSPPTSPGGTQRASSPSMWSARYDFSTSLRNPKSGSRTTDAGRAAALDYFSSKPSASSPIKSHFVISTASPTGSAASTPRATPEQSPNFQHKFGMLSPGLEHGVVEHHPINSNNPSPTMSMSLAVPAGMGKFNSFPPNRNMQSPGADWTHNDQANSADVFTSSLSSGSNGSLVIKPDGLVLEDYTPDGSQASPTSLTGSPNSFSPAMSVSSLESDSTINMTGLNGTGVKNGSDKLLTNRLQQLDVMGSSCSSFLRDDDYLAQARRSSYSAEETSGHHSYSPSSSVHSSTHSPISELATPDDVVRPNNMTSFNELVARFCWNSDNQLPATDADLAHLDATPPTNSGRTTPTASASAF